MSVIFFIKTTFNSDLNHILNCVNKCDFGTKCFAKVEHFVLRLIGKTVRAMDILFPQIGEIIGGSERESDYLKLRQRMEELGMNMKQLWWYLETRKFGTVPHAGFGLGFERLVLFVTGMSNIRDVIPFPRTPKNANF